QQSSLTTVPSPLLLPTSSPTPPLSTSLPLTPPTTTYTYTLSLHDALPILIAHGIEQVLGNIHRGQHAGRISGVNASLLNVLHDADRKSTRLNSSHLVISYAVFCLKKKNNSRDMSST